MESELLQEQPPKDHPEVAFFDPPHEEIGFCNCENAEQLTPYEAESMVGAILEVETAHAEEPPCNETVFATNAASCKESQTAEELLQTVKKRLAEQPRRCACNPYLEHTKRCQLSLYRNPSDPTPIDSVKTESVRGATWRSLLLAAGIGIATMLFLSRMLKKEEADEEED